MKWPMVELGHLVTITGGGTPDRGEPAYWGGNISWATVKDLIDVTLDHTQESITPDGLAHSAANVVPAGTVIAATRMALGKTVIATIDMAINQDLKALSCKPALNARYLLHFLNSKADQIERMGKGATVKGITLDVLKSLNTPLPPLPEQKRIAAILDKADAIRRKRQESIRLADDFLRSAFLDMFGDPVTNPKGWRKAPLQSVFSKTKDGTKCGPFGSALKKEEITTSGVPVWTMYNIVGERFVETGCVYITEDKFRQLASYAVSDGDIIISRAGTVGKMCVVETSTPHSIISTNLIRLSLDSTAMVPHFFVGLMTYCKRRMGRLKTGDDDAYTYMNTSILASLVVPVPPLARQQAFAALLQQVRETVSRTQAASNDADTLFQSLSHRAFAGELS